MKKIVLLLAICMFFLKSIAQLSITDEAIINQQERMVFKSWDRDKFTPSAGFLGLNPLYWLTWGLHPDYPKTDLRPLSADGEQSQRLGLLLAMNQSDEHYKAHSDTLFSLAGEKLLGHSALYSDLDPLWQLFYQSELNGLTSSSADDPLAGLTAKERDFLISSGVKSWYDQESELLTERLRLARETDMERGSRIMLYHRILLDYRKLQASLVLRKLSATRQLKALKVTSEIKAGSIQIKTKRSDRQIADEILKHSKL